MSGSEQAGERPDFGACPVRPDPHAGCPVSGLDPAWSTEAREHAETAAVAAAVHRGGDRDRSLGMAAAVVEQRARGSGVAAIQPEFVARLGRKLGYGHPLSERTREHSFTWTAEAEARLAEVPEFCRELTRWRVEWTAHKLGLGDVITPAEMDTKFELWGEVSHAIQARRDQGLPWSDSAAARFERVPEFVRGQVLEAVEGFARSHGASLIDDTVVDAVTARWAETGDFHEGRFGFK